MNRSPRSSVKFEFTFASVFVDENVAPGALVAPLVSIPNTNTESNNGVVDGVYVAPVPARNTP